MLSNVELNLHDSNGGAGSGTGTGIFGKVGVSPVESASPIVITGNMDAEMIREKLETARLQTLASTQWRTGRLRSTPCQ